MATQLKFNFTRGRMLWILENLHGKFPPQKQRRMRAVLEAIDKVDRGEMKPVQITHERFHKLTSESVTTIRRAINDLAEAQLIIVLPVIKGRGRLANQYQIVWTNLGALADGEETFYQSQEQSTLKSETLEMDTEPEPEEYHSQDYGSIPVDSDSVHNEQAGLSTVNKPECPQWREPSVHGGGTPLSTMDSPTSLSVSLRNPPPPLNHHRICWEEWKEVVEALRKLQLKSIKGALREAHESGAKPQDIQALIDHCLAYSETTDQGKMVSAWGPGALRDRITEWLPGQLPEDGWYGYSKEWTDWKARENYLARERRLREESQRRKAQSGQKQTTITNQREERFGSILDAMSDSEILEQLREKESWRYEKSAYQKPDWRKRRRTSLLMLLENGTLKCQLQRTE